MRILLLVPSLNFGGVETGSVDLSQSLKKLGEKVIVVSCGGILVKELEKYNIRHIQLPIHKKSLIALFQIPKLIRIIKEERIDIVHAQSRIPAWIAYFACKKTNTTFVTSCHGYYSKQFFSKVMGWGKRVIVISQVIAKHMQENFRVSREKICLIYRGVDLTRYLYQQDKYDKPKDKYIIVNISRLSPIKGHIEFIKAIDIVAKQKPNIEVWLVGSADEKKKHYEDNLHRLVKDLNLQDRVKFLGRRSDIPEILKDSDLLVLSTKVPEAFGRVLIEAGATGVAVCATNIGGISEIIEHRKDGLLFVPDDINSMSQAIITMLNNPELMKQCSINLRKKVKDKFSLELMARETLDVYNQALEEKKILVIKLGGLGDLILVVPSLRALRERFHTSKISLLIDSNFKSLFVDCPYIDELILFERKKDSFLRLLSDLKQKKFDISIDLKNNNFTHLISYLAKIPSRYGFSKGAMRFLLSYPEKLSKDLIEEPVEQQFRILKKLGILIFNNSLELWPSQQDTDSINNILNEKGVSGKDRMVGLVIGASKEWQTKNWPIEKLSKLSERLVREDLNVILLGTDYFKKNVDNFPKDKRIINFIGQTNLGQLVSLIKRLDILVTPDTAPMHIAAAVGTKIIALFGPTDPKKHIPPSKDISILVKELDCQPCYKRVCPEREKLACLKEIGVEEVFREVMKKLKRF